MPSFFNGPKQKPECIDMDVGIKVLQLDQAPPEPVRQINTIQILLVIGKEPRSTRAHDKIRHGWPVRY